VPIFSINVVNRHFTSSNKQDLPTADDASVEAIKAALELGIAEVSLATPFFGAEVSVSSGSERLARFVVSIGVSPIQ
jgi:hypothetical protein